MGNASLQKLAQDARSGVRERPLELSLASVTEIARPPPLPRRVVDGRYFSDPTAVQ